MIDNSDSEKAFCFLTILNKGVLNMQSKLAKSIMVMSLSLVISTSTINPVQVEAKT